MGSIYEYMQKLELEKDKSAQEFFKNQISTAIIELKNADNNIIDAKKELDIAYNGKVAKEKSSKLTTKSQEIKNIIKELEQRKKEIEQTINSINNEISGY